MAFQFSTGVRYGYQESRESMTDRGCRDAMDQIQQKAEFCLFSLFLCSRTNPMNLGILQREKNEKETI